MEVHALMADYLCMERMRIAIKAIRHDHRKGLLVARIRAASRERISGVPLAVIHLTILLQISTPTMNYRELRRMARDEALRFLDVS